MTNITAGLSVILHQLAIAMLSVMSIMLVPSFVESLIVSKKRLATVVEAARRERLRSNSLCRELTGKFRQKRGLLPYLRRTRRGNHRAL